MSYSELNNKEFRVDKFNSLLPITFSNKDSSKPLIKHIEVCLSSLSSSKTKGYIQIVFSLQNNPGYYENWFTLNAKHSHDLIFIKWREDIIFQKAIPWEIDILMNKSQKTRKTREVPNTQELTSQNKIVECDIDSIPNKMINNVFYNLNTKNDYEGIKQLV